MPMANEKHREVSSGIIMRYRPKGIQDFDDCFSRLRYPQGINSNSRDTAELQFNVISRLYILYLIQFINSLVNRKYFSIRSV